MIEKSKSQFLNELNISKWQYIIPKRYQFTTETTYSWRLEAQSRSRSSIYLTERMILNSLKEQAQIFKLHWRYTKKYDSSQKEIKFKEDDVSKEADITERIRMKSVTIRLKKFIKKFLWMNPPSPVKDEINFQEELAMEIVRTFLSTCTQKTHVHLSTTNYRALHENDQKK